MRVGAISGIGTGVSGVGYITSYSSIDSINFARRIEAQERRERMQMQQSRAVYMKKTNDIASDMVNRGVGTYDAAGLVSAPDVSGVAFDVKV